MADHTPGGWQPIETAPKDGTRILVYLPFQWSDGAPASAIDVIAYVPHAKFWCFPTPKNYVQRCEVEPTHWMPLPAAPALAKATAQ